MPNASDILWFKQEFLAPIQTKITGTPFSADLIVAVACQETGYIWQALRKKSLTTDEILALCVGDTIDASGGRKAFPKTKSDLIAKPSGAAMFDIARKALVEMAKHIGSYKSAAANPNKFCHGFGLFQYDLQFFLKDPNYFLQKKYEIFDETLSKCVQELFAAKKGMAGRTKRRSQISKWCALPSRTTEAVTTQAKG